MGTSIHLPPSRKMRSGDKKAKVKIVGYYLVDTFCIGFEFETGKIKRIDFLPLFQKYVKGENIKYLTPSLFKKFKVTNDRIFWGKNEDVAFSIPTLLKINEEEEILYII